MEEDIMATIKQRKTKYSVIYWYLNDAGERKQKWDTLETKKDAKARKAYIEFYQQKNEFVLVPPERLQAKPEPSSEIQPKDGISSSEDILLKDFLVIFVNLYGVSKWSASTYSSKLASINNYINPYIGNCRLNELTTIKLSQYYNDLLSVPEVPRVKEKSTGRCVQPANIKKIHDIIRCALNQAIRWEYLDTRMRNPASLATLPKMTKVKRKVWDIDTFRKATEAVDDDLLKICMHLAFSCSMRIGEITGLTWNDVIIDEESIHSGNCRVVINKELSRVSQSAMQKLRDKDIKKVFPSLKPHCTTRLVLKTPKTESSNRTVWLPETVAKLLIQYRQTQQELKEFLGSDYNDYGLVVALENGNPVESRIVRKRFQSLCEENGFPVVVFHSLRHLSTKYKLKMTHGDIKSVQGDTGHAEAEMVTDVYSEIVDEDRRLNAEKLNQEFYSAAAGENLSKNPSDERKKSDESILLELLKKIPKETREKLLKLSL